MNPEDYETQLESLQNEFAEIIAETSDEEILCEAKDSGEDLQEIADRVKTVLRNALKAHQQRKLREAEDQYKKRIAEIYEKRHALPVTPEARRTLLSKVFAKQPHMSCILTVQHREFESLTDADVETYLEQLTTLGVLGDLAKIEES